MRTLILFISVICSTGLIGQKFSVGYAYQFVEIADNSDYRDNASITESYTIYTPLKINLRLESENNFYIQFGIGERFENLNREYAEFDPSTWNEAPQNKYQWNLAESTLAVGYSYKIKRWNLSVDIGQTYSKVRIWQHSDYTFGESIQRHDGDFLTSDDMLDLEGGLGVAYRIWKGLRLESRVFGRNRYYTTIHGDKKYRLINLHPSHDQKYIYGLEVGFRYEFEN